MQLLACGAHADDVELGCGGTLAQSVRQGHAVAILDLTAGEQASNGSPELRAREAARAAEVLGVERRENAGLPDGGLRAGDADQEREIVQWLRRLRPDIVLVHSERSRHPDHVQSFHLLRAASFKAGLARYPADGEPHRPRALFQFMERFAFAPSFVVAIDSVVELKRQALSCYTSQFQRQPGDEETLINDPGFLDDVLSRDRFHGSLSGCRYAEPFLALQTPLLADLAAVLPGAKAGEVWP
jgi:bacillithiol biosynthesis deacetylase BshB1